VKSLCDTCQKEESLYNLCGECFCNEVDERTEAKDKRIRELEDMASLLYKRYLSLIQDAHGDADIPCNYTEGQCLMCTEIKYFSEILSDSIDKQKYIDLIKSLS